MALLSDPGSAGRWREAITLIDRAAAAGEAEAIERRALFECMGVARHPDWNKALDSLTDAAERASLKAQQQLLLLADDRLETVSPILNWREVRVAHHAWVTPAGSGWSDTFGKSTGPGDRRVSDAR